MISTHIKYPLPTSDCSPGPRKKPLRIPGTHIISVSFWWNYLHMQYLAFPSDYSLSCRFETNGRQVSGWHEYTQWQSLLLL